MPVKYPDKDPDMSIPPDQLKGVRCPRCLHRNDEVVKTVHITGQITLRHRFCESCQKQWRTAERTIPQ